MPFQQESTCPTFKNAPDSLFSFFVLSDLSRWCLSVLPARVVRRFSTHPSPHSVVTFLVQLVASSFSLFFFLLFFTRFSARTLCNRATAYKHRPAPPWYKKKEKENVMLGLTQAPYPVPNCGNRRTRFRKPSQSACFAYKLRLWQVPAGNQEGNSAYDSHVQQFALLSPGGEKAGNFEMHLYCIDQDALHR